MILTCPDCATSYFVDDERVPPHGRTVKCSSCGARWLAAPESAPAAVPEQLPAEPAETAAALPIPDPDLAEPPEADDGGIDFVAGPIAPTRERGPKAKRRGGRALWIGLGVLAVLAVAGGAAVLLRQRIVEVAPQAAPLYTRLGLEVDTLGLVIEDAKSTPVLQGGRPVLAVTGAIRNTRDAPVHAPPIRLSLLDKDDKVLTSLVAEATNANIPPGAKRYFAVSMPDPPAGVHRLEIGFELEAKADAATAAHGAEAGHGPAPVEATPLAPDAPDALPKHDEH
jgi:predicted Zn finger-like uncharacterized protein